MKKTAKRLLSRSPKLYRYAAAGYKITQSIKGARDSRWNYIKCMYSAVRKLDRSLGTPILLNIEPTNICDQKCTICETGLNILERPKKVMTFDEFKYLLDQFNSNLREIFFYFMGEPFLNKDAYRMIRYAADRGIYVSSCTNGNKVKPKELVESGIGEVSFQIGGMTQEVHEKYRAGGSLEKALRNLEETIEWKRKLNLQNPKIVTGFILMRHNEHQVEDFISYAQKVGVDEYQIIGTCARTVEQAKEYLPTDRQYWYYDEEELAKGNLIPKIRPNNYCEWLYFTITIQVNGDVVPCCRDPKGKMVLGNVFQENIYNIWNNEKYRKMRKDVTTRQKDIKLCELCSGYSAPLLR
ncbi:MAG: radical SAM protein [bacterium]|nr:radical SAM protein [bacterium]